MSSASRHTATAAQMGKEWFANLSLWPRSAHEPLVFQQLSFYAADQKHFFVIVGLNFIPTDCVSRDTRRFLLRLSCFLACVRKNEKKAKENRECVKNKKWKMNINCSYPKSNYLDVVWYQSALCWRSWILKLEQRCWLIAWSSASKTCGFLCLGAKANTTFHCCSEEFKGVNVHTARKPINSSSPRSDTVLTQKFHWTLHKDIQET